MAPPRFKFGTSLDPEAFQNVERVYISAAIFSGIKDPNADVLQFQISGLKNEKWETIGRISLYRDQQEYSEIPQTRPPVQQQEPSSISEQGYIDKLSEESKDNPFLSEEKE